MYFTVSLNRSLCDELRHVLTEQCVVGQIGEPQVVALLRSQVLDGGKQITVFVGVVLRTSVETLWI